MTPALVMLWLSAIVVLPFVSRLAGQPTSLGPAVAGTSLRLLRGGYTTSNDVTTAPYTPRWNGKVERFI
jgi:hypothetical protein